MKRSLIALALAAVLPLSVQAGEIPYSYVEASYLDSHVAGENGDGFGLAGSVGFSDSWYGSASYRRVDNNDYGIELDETTVNLGWRHALSDKADFIAELGYVDVGAVYQLNDTWGITASYDTTKLFDERINTWGLGIRASF